MAALLRSFKLRLSSATEALSSATDVGYCGLVVFRSGNFLTLSFVCLALSGCSMSNDRSGNVNLLKSPRYNAISEGEARERVQRYFGSPETILFVYSADLSRVVYFDADKRVKWDLRAFGDKPDWYQDIRNGLTSDQVIALKGKPTRICEYYHFFYGDVGYQYQFCYDDAGRLTGKTAFIDAVQ